MKLTKVTITGIDERTDLHELCWLSDEYPFVEFGVLLSKNREGKEPRYPSRKWIDDAVRGYIDDDVQLAGHLCGSFARDHLIWAINRNDQFRRFGRIQLNGLRAYGSTVKEIDQLSEETNKTFILQVSHWNSFSGTAPQHGVEFLIDNSGGRGKPLEYFTEPPTGIRGGYSGGISPSNIQSILEILADPKTDTPFWIDMESGVRTDDWFDINKAGECLKIASAFARK